MGKRFVLRADRPTVRLYPGRKTSKRIIKFLAEWHGDPKMTAYVIGRSPNAVIKGIANLAYNLAHNDDVSLSKKEQELFSQYRDGFDFLTKKGISLEQKRKVLSGQRGGALPAFLLPLIPIIAKVGLKLLGSAALGAGASAGAAVASKVIGE